MDTNFDFIFSPLPKTWVLDVDGTLLKHNGHKETNEKILPGVKEFFESISEEDYIILITAREEEHRHNTIKTLTKYNIKWNTLVMGVPTGERILVNDVKPSGLKTAFSLNLQRDKGLPVNFFKVDQNL